MWNGGLSKHCAIVVNDETATTELPPTFQPTSPSSLVVGLEKTLLVIGLWGISNIGNNINKAFAQGDGILGNNTGNNEHIPHDADL